MSELFGFPWWALLLMLIGALGMGTLVLNLFSSVGDRPDRAVITGECAAGSMEFLLAVAGATNSPIRSGGTARLLNNGDAFIPAMVDAIAAAESTVNLTTYIWRDGEVSDAFFDALIGRARAGVEVRVLIDGFGGLRAPGDRIDALKEAGGRWESFHLPRFGKLTRLHKRTHRRALVVDGSIGFTGGAAVMDKWMGDAEDPEHWRDSMVEVRGALAHSVQAAFAQLWAHTTGEIVSGPRFYPVRNEVGDAEEEGERILRHINFISSPSGEAHPMRLAFWCSIEAARRRVLITNPYFVPDDLLLNALKDRARAGVDVRVLVPGEHIDILLIRWASHSYYEVLLEAGVRIYEYRPTMLHQKLMVVDGCWSLVGSVNMDVRSKELNQENALGIYDPGFAAEVEETFHQDLARAEEIDYDRWRRRPWRFRIPERFFRLFEEQF